MSRPALLIVAFAFGATLAACNEDGGADAGDCESGLQGCACISGGLCVAGLFCEEGICQPEPGADTQSNDEAVDDDVDGDDGKPIPDQGDGDTSESESEGGTSDGTCVDHCGGVGSDGVCYCDTSCMDLGDCCPDYASACPGQCLSNSDCAPDEVCSSSGQTCLPAYGTFYRIWVEEWTDLADVCWDADSCADADPFYSINLGGFYEFTSVSFADTGTATWWSDPASLQIDGNQSLYIYMEDEDISIHDWILTWGPKNGQGQYIAPPVGMLHDGFAYDDCWEGAGEGCYVVHVRFVAE